MRNQIPRLCLAAVLMYSAAMHQASAQVRTATASPAKERIRVDGSLDEPAWQTATPIGALIQVLPKEGAEATEKTEIRVLVDGEALYFGIICFDRNPSAIITTQLARDGDLFVDDHLIIALDPFLDHRNGFWFDINAAGARADGQISNNSNRPSVDWDGI
jgi:hypothetical protein